MSALSNKAHFGSYSYTQNDVLQMHLDAMPDPAFDPLSAVDPTGHFDAAMAEMQQQTQGVSGGRKRQPRSKSKSKKRSTNKPKSRSKSKGKRPTKRVQQ